VRNRRRCFSHITEAFLKHGKCCKHAILTVFCKKKNRVDILPHARTDMVRLSVTGEVGFSTGMKWIVNPPSEGDFDADNDGIMSTQHGGLIDLSHLASRSLGMQVPQSAKFTIRSIRMMLRNVDDLDDNDEGNWFSGTLRWYQPTKHRLKALALAREAEKYAEADQYDGDSFFLRNDNDYRGLRFGWTNSVVGVENQIAFQSSENFTEIEGVDWNLYEVFRIYNEMHPATKDNALFGGRGGNDANKMLFTVANASGIGAGDAPAVLTDWNSGPMNHECLAGLLFFNIADSGGDESGSVDDDYKMVVCVDFDVGVDA